MTKWTEKESRNKLVVELHNKGCNNQEIASNFEVSTQCVALWLKELGLTRNPKIKPFTEQEKLKMVELHELPTSVKRIAEIIETTQARVAKFLNDSGYDTSYHRFNKETVAEILTDYSAGLTQDDLAEKYCTFRQCINYLLTKHGVVKRTKREYKQNKWYVDETAFQDMTDERGLFFYGLLLTDGCVGGKNDRAVVITLQKGDVHILQELQKYLGIERELIYSRGRNANCQDTATLSFMDTVVSDRLKELGLTPRKSCKETLPKVQMTDDQARHFWRGCVAGDGSVKNYSDIPHIYLCGSYELCNEFSLYIQRNIGLKVAPKVVQSKSKTEGKESPLFYTRVNGSKARDIADILFRDSTVNIERKYNEYLKFKDYAPKYEWFRDRVALENK